MRSKAKALKIIAEKLKGIPWAIYSGTAVEIFTSGKRKGRDIDVIVSPDKMDEVGRRFGVRPILETRGSENIKTVNNYHIETEIAGIPVEFIGKTEKFIINGEEYHPASLKNFRKLFQKVRKAKYLGVEVFVVSLEEILAQKLIWNRKGDWNDEEDVKLLRRHKISRQLLIGAFERWGVSKSRQEELIKRYEDLKGS